MVALTLRAARGSRTRSRARPRSWDELPFERRGAAGRAGRGRRRSDAGGARARGARAALGAARCSRRPSSPATGSSPSCTGRSARGCSGSSARCGPHGTLLITEDVCVPPDAGRRGGQGHPGAARQTRVPHRRWPATRRAGNLHFMLTPDMASPSDRERYEAFMGELTELIVEQVRRLAEGRARHRPQHGSLRRARVGREGDGDDVADQGARRPDGVLAPGVRAQPGPRRAHARPEADAADRGGGGRLHRVRLLRAGVPQPRPDHDSAPADRDPARDGCASRPARPCCARCSSSTNTTPSRPAPATAPAGSRARCRSTPAS